MLLIRSPGGFWRPGGRMGALKGMLAWGFWFARCCPRLLKSGRSSRASKEARLRFRGTHPCSGCLLPTDSPDCPAAGSAEVLLAPHILAAVLTGTPGLAGASGSACLLDKMPRGCSDSPAVGPAEPSMVPDMPAADLTALSILAAACGSACWLERMVRG